MATHRRVGLPPALAAAVARLAPIAAPLFIVGLALALRLAGLDAPDRQYFDEVYYVEEARSLRARGVEDGFVVHPPVGKWLIGAGMAVAGDTPFGWRLASAVAGGLLVAVVYLAGLRLLSSRGAAALAALLVAVDGLAITMSRIAMLDIFLALFVTGGFVLLLADRDRIADPSRSPPRLASPARWCAGALLGLAVATKWAGLLAIGAAVLALLVLEARRSHAGWPPSRLASLAGGLLLPLVALPALVYLASYGGWFANFAETRPGTQLCEAEPCEAGPTERLGAWAREQRAIARFHLTLEAAHPYRAPAWTWPVMTHPVVYSFESCRPDRDPAAGPCEVPPGTAALIHGVGNPVVWWAALAAYPALAWAAVRRRDGAAGWLLAFLLGQYLPWLAAARPVFFFYATPVVPFVALALAWGVSRTPRRLRAPLGWGLATTAAAAAAFWFPVWVGAALPDGAWLDRMLLGTWY